MKKYLGENMMSKKEQIEVSHRAVELIDKIAKKGKLDLIDKNVLETQLTLCNFNSLHFTNPNFSKKYFSKPNLFSGAILPKT